MKRGHLTELEAAALAFGERIAGQAEAHPNQCADCAALVAALAESRRLVAAAELPEPAEAFWHRLRADIAAGVERDAARPHFGVLRMRWSWALAAATAVLLSVATWSLWGHWQPLPPTTHPAWVPLSAPDEDYGFALVSEVVPVVDEERQGSVDCGVRLEEWTAEESQRVIEALRGEMGRKS